MRLTDRLLFTLRNILARDMFAVMRRYVQGHVLDVGGWDFFLYARAKQVNFDRWTTLEYDRTRGIGITDPKFELVHGDGCHMEFPDSSFDTVLNIQVLEHVFEPIKMVEEISRVLKKGGYAIFLVPQTANLHMAPNHFYNFTRYWLSQVCHRSGLEVVELKAQGGAWTTIASRLFYFFLQAARAEGRTPKNIGGTSFFTFYTL